MSIEILRPPSDGITSLTFAPDTTRNLLAAASWDKRISLYDVDSNSLVSTFEQSGPIFDCSFVGDSTRIACGGATGTLMLFDVNSGRSTVVGSHDEPIRCVKYHPKTNVLYSGGWDRCIKAWDFRSRPGSPISTAKLHGKIFSMDVASERLVAVDSLKRTYVYLIRSPNLNQPEIMRDQILKFQMRCLRCFPDNQGFAVSSVEGRVAWEFFSPDPVVQSRKYAFKCHRLKGEDGQEIAYPVNALAFHPNYGTFATGGGDGGVSVWDGHSKKRLWRLPAFSTSVTSMAFNTSGTQLAVAASYAFEQGPKADVPPPQIIVRTVKDDDVKPKAAPDHN